MLEYEANQNRAKWGMKCLALKATEKSKNLKLEFSVPKGSSGGLICE